MPPKREIANAVDTLASPPPRESALMLVGDIKGRRAPTGVGNETLLVRALMQTEIWRRRYTRRLYTGYKAGWGSWQDVQNINHSCIEVQQNNLIRVHGAAVNNSTRPWGCSLFCIIQIINKIINALKTSNARTRAFDVIVNKLRMTGKVSPRHKI